MRILGVDPGSRLTGYGCIDLVGNQLRHVTHGTLRLSNTSGKAVIPLEERLLSIYEGLSEVILKYKPQILSVEKVFFAKNAVSALKLGQARGAVILTGMIHSLAFAEYSPTEVKQMVVGHGRADKDQIARTIQLLFGKQEFATSDASDGLALAICHAYSVRSPTIALSSPSSSSSTSALAVAEALRSFSGKRNKKKLSMAEAVGAVVESQTKGKGRNQGL
jgi:crossover junction endodeoxyribonuclease RuvC